MSLADLPPELLMQILEYVGSGCFLEDARLLTVSRGWFACARAVRVMDLKLSQRSLQRLISSPNAQATFSLMKINLKRLDLDLVGFEDWGAMPDGLIQDIAVRSGRGKTEVVLAKWTTWFNRNLSQLATVIQDARNLQVFKMKAATEHDPLFYILPRRDYLYPKTVQSIIDVTTLTVLDLDIRGTSLVSLPHDHNFHICERIGSLLSTLRSLRLRLRNICADVLEPHGSALRYLNKVVINLSLYEPDPPIITAASHSVSCGIPDGSFLDLQATLEQQAQILVNNMRSPKLLRILTHSMVQLELQSFDALTGRRMILSEGSDWADDGSEVEGADWDIESDISSLSWDD